jgi:DNA-directed RNA polymerase subunit K/omega
MDLTKYEKIKILTTRTLQLTHLDINTNKAYERAKFELDNKLLDVAVIRHLPDKSIEKNFVKNGNCPRKF